MDLPQLPINIIIKILTYLSRICTICEDHQLDGFMRYHICEKKIKSPSFLKLRFLRKKIAEVFQPKYFFYLSKRKNPSLNFDEDIKNLPKHITCLRFHYSEPNPNKQIENILITNPQIYKIHTSKTYFYYYPTIGGKNNFLNITVYKGPYFAELEDFSSLEKITIYHYDRIQPSLPRMHLRKLKLYLTRRYDVYFNTRNYKKLRYLFITGEPESSIHRLKIDDNLETLIIKGIVPRKIKKNENNTTNIIIN